MEEQEAELKVAPEEEQKAVEAARKTEEDWVATEKKAAKKLSKKRKTAEALTEIVKVLKFLRRDMVTGFGEVVDAIDKEYLEEEESDEDSEPELEVTPGELTDLAAESKEGEWYWEWLVETGRVVKSDEEVEEKVEEKKDEVNGENGEKGKEVEVAAE